MASINDIQDYRTERQNRRRRRNYFIQKIAKLKQKITEQNYNNKNHAQLNMEQPKIIGKQQITEQIEHKKKAEDESILQKQNLYLKDELARLEEQEREKLVKFKNQINAAKELYISKIRQISQFGRKQKQHYTAQSQKLSEQIANASEKTKQIEKNNANVEKQIKNTEEIGMTYATEIEQQYKQKLTEFQQIFNSSSDQIAKLQQKMDNEDLVQSTLANEQIVQSIRENAEKSQNDIDRIFSDYQELLTAKTQIIQQIKQTLSMKEKEVQNCKVLEGKLKNIIDKLNQEKEIYVSENLQMNKQLLDIKVLLEKVIGSQQ